jgi:NADH dehydrogenase
MDAHGKIAEPHVLILGAGFGGVAALKALAKSPARVTLIDRNTYQSFQPLLYQVATDELSIDEVGFPLRNLLRGHPRWAFHKALVTGIDLEKKQVTVEGMAPFTYDYLVIALGAVVNFFGIKGAAEHAFPLYTLRDAVRLKAHVLKTFEATDRDPSLAADGALTVCVVGGGATGVEVAGALAELIHYELRDDYPSLPMEKAEVVLYEMGPELLGPFKPRLRAYAKRALEKLGVRVCLGEGVVEIEPTRVHLKSGGVVKAHTLVWGAGLQANPLDASIGVPLVHGRVPVDADLRLSGHPDVFVVGDAAVATDAKSGRPLPQLGSVAKQAGRAAGRNITSLIDGRPPQPFRYLDRGTMATVGRGAAVVELPWGMTMTGFVAWLAWLFVHLALLAGGVERSLTLRDWVWNLLTRRRGKRIVID